MTYRFPSFEISPRDEMEMEMQMQMRMEELLSGWVGASGWVGRMEGTEM